MIALTAGFERQTSHRLGPWRCRDRASILLRLVLLTNREFEDGRRQLALQPPEDAHGALAGVRFVGHRSGVEERRRATRLRRLRLPEEEVPVEPSSRWWMYRCPVGEAA